ncbi:MAG: class I SAM-dependent methyltransferase [Candidatus Eremiobacteraeota bacterium]|nr:class I SAM-dependent methyltransferase [Candidatus Eremiobacteraeota bacterium]
MPPTDFDVYQGMSWTERARHGVFGIALDLADRMGKKNRFMDAVHQIAIRRALGGAHRSFRRALDFGCGGGRLLPLLKDYAAEVYGVDRTQACLDLATARNIIPPERLLCWRESVLPFASGFFDLVLCVYVLLTQEALTELTGELGRVCASGGLAVVLEQADNRRALTLESYETAFAAAGFKVQSALPVRHSSGSRAMALATRPWSPAWLAPLAAGWELTLASSSRYTETTPGYYDYLFLLVKT